MFAREPAAHLASATTTYAIEQLNPAILPERTGAHTHGTVVTGACRTVFVNAQVPWAEQDVVLPDFADQAGSPGATSWPTWRRHGRAEPRQGDDLPVRPGLPEENSRIRHEALGDHRPAITIIITDIYAPQWLLEIEAVAVD